MTAPLRPDGQPEHSTGPWQFGERRGDYQLIDAPHSFLEWRELASVVVVVDGESDAEGEANARLIAAAPDLLAACKAVVDSCTSAPPIELVQRLSACANQCADAIARAEPQP